MRLVFKIVNNFDNSKRVTFFNVENFRQVITVILTNVRNRMSIGFQYLNFVRRLKALVKIGTLSEKSRLAFLHFVKTDAKGKKPIANTTFKCTCRQLADCQKVPLFSIYLYFNIKYYIIIGFLKKDYIYNNFEVIEKSKPCLNALNVYRVFLNIVFRDPISIYAILNYNKS